MSLEATHVDICRDETTRTAYPRLASSKGIAATGVNSAVIAALEKAAACNNDVLERAPADADLQYAPRKGIIVTEHKNGILEKNVYFNDNLTSGTGSENGFLEHAQAYLWQLPEEKIFQVLRLSSLFDVYSDDNIVCMKPEQYRI